MILIPRKRNFDEDRGATNIARLIMILSTHREIKVLSDGKKLLKLILYKMTKLNFKDFVIK